jgi:glycolate oxidase
MTPASTYVAPELSAAFIDGLRNVLSDAFVLCGEEDLRAYGHDETEDLSYPPQVVVRPRTTEEVANTVRLCSAHGVPITPIVCAHGPQRRGAELARGGGAHAGPHEPHP